MLKKFFKKYREIITYLFFGCLAFIVSVLTYGLFNLYFGINELIANIFSWIITVAFAYITNKLWVFRSRNLNIKQTCFEICKFFGGRVATLAIEELILYMFITRLGFDSMFIKIVAQIVVIILNYIISKIVVFSNGESKW